MEKSKAPNFPETSQGDDDSLGKDPEGGGLEGYIRWLHLPSGIFEDFAGKRVLDLGTGKDLNFARDLEKAGIKVKSIVSVSPDFANEKWRNGIKDRKTGDMIVAAKGEELPFPDEHFDRVVSVNVIEFIKTAEDYQRFLKEAARVLAPGGIAYIGPIPDEIPLFEDEEYIPMKLLGLQQILGPHFRVEWEGPNSEGSAPLILLYTLKIERKFHAED